MKVFLWLSFIFFFLGLGLYLLVFCTRKKNRYQKEVSKKMPRICVLIPARNESNVIEGLLKSLENQTYPVLSKNIYVIVESIDDPTVELVKKHQMSYFIRQKLELKTKGYALAELIESLAHEQNEYDLYFVFDADNLLDPHFMEEMVKEYQKGYAFSTGYRALKNKNHYISVSAWLTFFLMNNFKNKRNMKKKGNVIFSGTGYYIHGDYIKKWKTFPFHSLTEDYECSLYCALHGISTHYNELAIFYDEQPTKYQTSILQRSRWIKGYMQNWRSNIIPLWKQVGRKNTPNRGSLISFAIGISPVLCFLLSILFLLFFFMMISFQKGLFLLIIVLFGIYILLASMTYLLLQKEQAKLQLSKKVFYQTIFYHPWFIMSYLHAFFKFLFQKDLGWSIIEHNVKEKE